MGEVSDEIELDLGLSIGRSFKKSENSNSKPVSNEPAAILNQHPEGERSNVFDADASESHAPPRSGASVMDPQTKREIHALRRQEAKRKREEKQQKRGQSRARNGEMCGNGGSSVSDDEKAWVNKDQLQSRVRENGDAKGEELDSEEGQCNKKNKMENGGSANLNSNQSNGVAPEQPIGFASSSPYPIMQMQFPYPPIQYMPLSNGFAIPYVMPCWAPNGAAAAGSEKQVAQPVVCRSFVPFQANQIATNGCESEQNGSGGNRKATSNGSPMCSSSVVSDNRSSSLEGGNSSEARSHSSHSLPEQPHIPDGAKGQIEHSASSKIVRGPGFVKANHIEKTVASRPNEETNGPKVVEKAVASNVAQPRTPEARVEAAPESQPNPANKPKSPSPENLKEVKGEAGKPPKPQTQNQCAPSLPQMPCVSTTGNGPNGKTITGFLYRYTKTEVSIVCVCHGNSFTPAEFVAHAGGTDISNPLKHITVIPSALG